MSFLPPPWTASRRAKAAITSAWQSSPLRIISRDGFQRPQNEFDLLEWVRFGRGDRSAGLSGKHVAGGVVEGGIRQQASDPPHVLRRVPGFLQQLSRSRRFGRLALVDHAAGDLQHRLASAMAILADETTWRSTVIGMASTQSSVSQTMKSASASVGSKR